MFTSNERNERVRVPKIRPIGTIHKLYPPIYDDARSLIAAGKYDFVDDGMSSVELSWDDRDEILVDLMGFEGTFTTEELLPVLGQGAVPAPFGVLLLFGAVYPAAQTGFHVTQSDQFSMKINWHDPQKSITRLLSVVATKRKIVCLGTRISCCVQNYDLAVALTHDDTFTERRGLVGLAFDRNWSGEEHCFLRVLQ